MEIELTKKQEQALDSMKKGLNVFLTGPAGTGKSFLLKEFIQWFQLNKEDEHSKIYITSTTGLSSILIDGMTINRYAGIGIGDKDIETYYKKIIKMKSLKNRWLSTKVLIIDEISMMDPDLFDKLETLSRKIRKNDKPFGGIQVILSGDFLQIPPVKNNGFCFESFTWDFINKTYYFDEILRQDNNILQNVLNKIRLGIVDNEVKNLLDSCLNKELNTNDGIIPTLLFSKKNMVIEYNEKELKKLIDNGNQYYNYNSSYDFNKKKDDNTENNFYIDLINSQFQIDDNIILALHSQVMLTINMPEHNLANGSRGIIIDFTKDEFHHPVVLFTNSLVLTIKEHDFTIDEDKSIIKKKQLPLILSWAITIHKAQGMTLDFIKTDIGSSIFEYGQAYVVLSRIKNINGLSLINIDYSKIKAHPKIIKYYDKLSLQK
jgi:ATP-dependent DNA helicase PIF1